MLGTVHMLSNSDLYPNVRVSVPVLAKPNLSAALGGTCRQWKFDKSEICFPFQRGPYIKELADVLVGRQGVLLMHCAGRIILIYLVVNNTEDCWGTDLEHRKGFRLSQVVHSKRFDFYFYFFNISTFFILVSFDARRNTSA